MAAKAGSRTSTRWPPQSSRRIAARSAGAARLVRLRRPLRFQLPARSLDRTWLAFANARAPEVQALAKRPDPGFKWGVAGTLELSTICIRWKCPGRHAPPHPLRQEPRLPRGALLRDGLVACDGLADIFEPSKVLRWGGWSGPDTKGKSYAQNPLHPDVYGFYKTYMQALLGEVGKEVDGFIWDETFQVLGGDLAPPRSPAMPTAP